MAKKINRKKFLKTAAAVGMGSVLLPNIKLTPSRKRDEVRLGFIGTGLRGQWRLDLASKRDEAAEQLQLESSVVASRAALEQIAWEADPAEHLLNWQRTVLGL